MKIKMIVVYYSTFFLFRLLIDIKWMQYVQDRPWPTENYKCLTFNCILLWEKDGNQLHFMNEI